MLASLLRHRTRFRSRTCVLLESATACRKDFVPHPVEHVLLPPKINRRVTDCAGHGISVAARVSDYLCIHLIFLCEERSSDHLVARHVHTRFR